VCVFFHILLKYSFGFTLPFNMNDVEIAPLNKIRKKKITKLSSTNFSIDEKEICSLCD
jgi:hypothetical protein